MGLGIFSFRQNVIIESGEICSVGGTYVCLSDRKFGAKMEAGNQMPLIEDKKVSWKLLESSAGI